MNRCAIVLVAALLLAGCSGSRPFGVGATTEGTVEILSACRDTGLADIRIVDDQTLETLVELRAIGPREDLPASVEIPGASASHEALITAGVPLSGVVRVNADYPLAATFTEPVVVDLDELGPDDVATTVVRDGGRLETRIQSRQDFSSSIRSCRGWNVPTAVWLVALVGFAAGGLVAAGAIWRFIRGRRSAPPTSRLPAPPPRPTG